MIRAKNKLLALLLCLVSFIPVASAQTGQASPDAIEELQVPAPSLAGNLLGDPAVQRVLVYLPPSYKRETTRRYPTLYLLHGYTSSPGDWVNKSYQGMTVATEMNSLIAKGAASEMIIVVPNGRNAYLGSFYTNSPVTGNWEDYIYRDVVSYIDGRYRTISKSASRGIAGHSMGGYGAFTLAMKHPDVFGAIYALSPCCLGLEGDIAVDNPNWARAAKITSRDVFTQKLQSFDDFFGVAMIALSSALSPNKDRAPMYVDLPYVQKNGVLMRNEPAYSSYRAKMPLYNVERYRDNLMKLRGIFLDVGENDEFTHIRKATPMLSAELSRTEIPHAFEIYKDGDHGSKIRERFTTKVIPFFSAVLEK